MNFNSLFAESIRIRSQLLSYQTVRWRRSKKPFWLGIAKSKMFVVPQPRIIPTPEEKLVNSSLWRHYKTHVKSIMNFIRVDNPMLTENVTVEGKTVKADPVVEEQISKSMKVNEDWNKESARRRDERMKVNMQAEIEKAIKEIDVHEEIKMKQMEVIEEIVRKEKQLSGSYITPENLDEAVENCLNQVECYDFAIDLDGNKYSGRESLPSQVDISSKEISAENVS